MRVPFWPRKNARLERRLTTVIEKSEEVRKSIKTPPARVVIDTSYVEQHSAIGMDEAGHAEEYDGPAYEEMLRSEAHRLLEQESDFEEAARQAAESGPASTPSRAPKIASRTLEAEANAQEWAALQEAEDYRDYISRLEEETVREDELRKAAEAKLAEAARLEAEAQEALASLQRLAEERVQAEENERLARDRALAAQREAAVQRKRAEELEAEFERQMTGREAALAEAAAAEQRLADLQAEITSANADVEPAGDLQRRDTEIKERKAAAEAELRTQIERVSALEAEIKREREQRLLIEQQRDTALVRIREGEHRVSQLRQSMLGIEEALKRQAEERALVEARRAEAQSKRAMAELLEAQVTHDRAALERVAADTEDKAGRAAGFERAVAELEEREQALLAELNEAQSAGFEEHPEELCASDGDLGIDPGAAERDSAEELEALPEEVAAPPARAPLDAEVPAPSAKLDSASSANPRRERLQQAIVKQQAQPATSRHGVVQTQPPAAAGQRPRDIDLAAASSVDSPVPLRVKTMALPDPPQAAAKGALVPAKQASGEGTKAERRDRRVSEQKPATLWQERMSEPVNCVIRDKSASGAMIEIMPSKFGGKSHTVAVGDKYTLTVQVARERSHVTCEVMRVEGRRCGVRFCGPFRTEIQQKARSKPAKARSSLLG